MVFGRTPAQTLLLRLLEAATGQIVARKRALADGRRFCRSPKLQAEIIASFIHPYRSSSWLNTFFR
jgi:hypothetical protein